MRRAPWIMLILIVVATGCGGGGDGGTNPPPPPPPPGPPPPPPPPPPPAAPPTLTLTAGSGQTAPLGSRLDAPMRIVVTRDGVPLSGQAVTWSTGALHGFFDPMITQTAADGSTTVFWTLGIPTGTQMATATVTGANPVTFSATATAGQAGNPVDVHLTSINGFRYQPANVVIAAGTAVRWIWDDDIHDVVPSGTPSFTGIGGFFPPKTHQFTFTTTGTYRYFCSFHGTANTGMRGVVVVQ